MKHLVTLSALAITLCACKKDRTQAPSPETPKPVFPEWVTYNTTNSALPADQVNALAISSSNIKWMATTNGLARLEGDHWKVYNMANSPLPSNNIQAVTVEVNGTVWAGTDKGLARFAAGNWTIYNTTNSALTDDRIKCLIHDAAHGTTWVGTEDGIVKISNGRWEHLETIHTVLSMAADASGALWMGLFNDFAFIGMIKKYANGQWTTYRLDQLGYTSAFPYDIKIDRQGRPVAVLAGTVVKAVIRFDGSGWTELERPEKARGLRSLLLQDDDVWVGGSTLSRFGAKDLPLVEVPVKDLYISGMTADADGRKWISTYLSGVAVYNP
ncbi:hypothetical protein LLH06_05865 [Mucilaginibacter daejeonensis]|uniref:ligand-binding sensor domain-containing protein n=1 Tax=Mucilaginibacter daejeonensis TaxID=398049 RepID=UPI001D176ABD|nr:hypothetical protein [Mucilaginibacter daejeonensis]UEG54488.1 hypothetical protein LLH06_05865 [Mucilaginibacter daejeonensis]